MSTRAPVYVLGVLAVVATVLVGAQAPTSAQAGGEASLVARLQQFIKDNPESPKLLSVYSSLLAAAGREGDPKALIAIADEAVARFPHLANDVAGAMTSFGRVNGETAADALAARLLETETSPLVLAAGAQALPRSGLRLLAKAIALRKNVESATEHPTLDDLTMAYAEALDRAGRHAEAARLQHEFVERATRRIAELGALPKDDAARSSLAPLRAALDRRYQALVNQAVNARQYQRALDYVKLWEDSAADPPLAFSTHYDERRAAVYAAMKAPGLELEAWARSFANCIDITARDRIRALAVQVGKKSEDVLQRARDVRAGSARPVAGFELKTIDGPSLSLASLTSKSRLTIFAFFFPT